MNVDLPAKFPDEPLAFTEQGEQSFQLSTESNGTSSDVTLTFSPVEITKPFEILAGGKLLLDGIPIPDQPPRRIPVLGADGKLLYEFVEVPVTGNDRDVVKGVVCKGNPLLPLRRRILKFRHEFPDRRASDGMIVKTVIKFIFVYECQDGKWRLVDVEQRRCNLRLV